MLLPNHWRSSLGSRKARCIDVLSCWVPHKHWGRNPLTMPVATPKAHSCWRSWDLIDSRKETWVQIWIGTEQGSGTFSQCPVVLVSVYSTGHVFEFCREEEKAHQNRVISTTPCGFCMLQASKLYYVHGWWTTWMRTKSKLTWSWKLKRAKIHARIIICLAAKSYFLRPEITPRSIISGKPLSSFKGAKHYRSSVTALLTSDCNQFFQHRNAVWCKQEDGEAGFSNQAAMFHRESSAPWLSCLWLA